MESKIWFFQNKHFNKYGYYTVCHMIDLWIYFFLSKQTSEKTEGAITNGQSKETGNIRYTRRRITKQKHSTICVRRKQTQIT